MNRSCPHVDYPKGEIVPFLRMSRRWLEEHGFEIEGEVFVEASQGRLILTNYPTSMAKAWESLP